MWGLSPQPVKEEYKAEVEGYIESRDYDKIKEWHFEKFRLGEHVTWQQWLLLLAVEDAIRTGKNKISVVSGHGTGKSSCLSWLIIWYLFCHLDAQIGATAPTSEQIHDVLWKEVSKWLDRMPDEVKELDLFDYQAGYIRVKERPDTWFARARTARKENPEAIAGLHGDFVFLVVDESSAVPDEIFRSAEGSLTGPNTLVILIGNGTRNTGYFYDSHHSDREYWTCLSFNSEESPIVEEGYIERMLKKWGRDSDEYRIRVLGGFPASEQMDDQGWIPLLTEKDIHISVDPIKFSPGRKVLGIDPSGEGDNLTVWVLRDNYFARVVAIEQVSNSKEIAARTLDIVREHNVDPYDIVIDNFGIGANVKSDLVLLDQRMNATAMNWAEKPSDEETFLNKRAECCFRAREWFLRGGTIYGDELRKDILAFMYRNNLSGKRQILHKPKLKTKLGRSPDRGDAFFMTFYHGVDLRIDKEKDSVISKEDFNPYALFEI